MPQAQQLLASAQVCEHVGIDRSTLSRYVKAGQITPAMRLPGRRGAMLFEQAAADKFKVWYHRDRLIEQAAG